MIMIDVVVDKNDDSNETIRHMIITLIIYVALAINLMAESLLQPSSVQQYIQSSCFDDSQFDLKLAKFNCLRPRR